MTVLEWVLLAVIVGWLVNVARFARHRNADMAGANLGAAIVLAIVLVLSLVFGWSS